MSGKLFKLPEKLETLVRDCDCPECRERALQSADVHLAPLDDGASAYGIDLKCDGCGTVLADYVVVTASISTEIWCALSETLGEGAVA